MAVFNQNDPYCIGAFIQYWHKESIKRITANGVDGANNFVE